MPTSSQSKILSVVDHQLLQQQQQTAGQETGAIKPIDSIPLARSRNERRSSIGKKNEEEEQSTSPVRRRSLARVNEKKFKNVRKTSVPKGTNVSRTSQRNDVLHIPVVNLNAKVNIRSKTPGESAQYRRDSWNVDYPRENEYLTTDPPAMGHNSSISDIENLSGNEGGEETGNVDQAAGLLNDSARRLLVLGTIRPSRSFYRDLPASDVKYLMEYFQRMRTTNRKISSEEINQELTTKSTEYKPKMFYDSSSVTRSQVHHVEKLIEPFVEQLRTHQAELIKLDNPLRFVIKPIDSDTPLMTIPRELGDCLLTLISRSDPLRKSELVHGLVSEKLSEEIKANSLDISYFPGGVNYDVPCGEVDENGQLNLDTYQKLKTRLNTRKVWYFADPPAKKPRALIAILPPYVSTTIDHQRLFDCLCDRLQISANNEEKILSIEFVPLSCILGSQEISDQFIIDCDSNETKQNLMEKPLTMEVKKQLITIELQSYDENMQKEYHKSIKAERYRELIQNHDAAVKRTSKK